MMPAKLIDLQQVSNIDEIVNQCINVLRSEGLIVVPTETVYGVAALASSEAAVKRLVALKGRRDGHALPLAISGYEMLNEFVPKPGQLGQRLARRCWPGPLTLVFDTLTTGSQLLNYPTYNQQAIMPEGTVGIRVPNCTITQEILYELNDAVVLSSANIAGESPAITAPEALASIGDQVGLIIDFGESDIKKPSSVVRVSDKNYEILREGAITAGTIEKLTAKIVLFVCTGNTCRSPMAEAICEKLLADRLGCSVDQLEERGYLIMSAGVAAASNGTASPMARQVIAQYGITLDGHQSQPITETLLRFADHIYVMARNHREAILSYWPGVDTRLQVLDPDGGDISDPIGGNYEVYKKCAMQIEKAIQFRIEEIASL